MFREWLLFTLMTWQAERLILSNNLTLFHANKKGFRVPARKTSELKIFFWLFVVGEYIKYLLLSSVRDSCDSEHDWQLLKQIWLTLFQLLDFNYLFKNTLFLYVYFAVFMLGVPEQSWMLKAQKDFYRKKPWAEPKNPELICRSFEGLFLWFWLLGNVVDCWPGEWRSKVSKENNCGPAGWTAHSSQVLIMGCLCNGTEDPSCSTLLITSTRVLFVQIPHDPQRFLWMHFCKVNNKKRQKKSTLQVYQTVKQRLITKKGRCHSHCAFL